MFEICNNWKGFAVFVATEEKVKEVCAKLQKELDANEIDASFTYEERKTVSVDDAVKELISLCDDEYYFEEQI